MNIAMVDYYDKLVAGIAVSLLGGGLLGAVAPVAFHVGLLGGALVATVLVYDALFRTPPLPNSHPKMAAAAVGWHLFLLLLFGLALS